MIFRFTNILATTALISSLVAGGSAFAQTNDFKDDNGDTVKVQEKIERIATAWPVIVPIVVSLDQGSDRLVAIPMQIKKTLDDSLIGELFPEMRKVSAKAIDNKRVVNIEEMLKLNPDIVFEHSNKTKSIKGIRSAGLTAFGLKSAKTNLDKNLLQTVGKVIGRTERTKDILSWRAKRFSEITTKTKQIVQKDRPTYLYLWQKQQLIGPGHHMTGLLKKAGARNGNTSKSSFVGYDKEMLLAIDPDFVFLHDVGTQKVPADFYNNPIFAELKAVKNRTIYKVPWDGPSPERALALEWFTRVLHGDDYLEGSMRESVAKAIPLLYGKSVNDDQIERVLLKEFNSSSAGYNSIIR